MTFPLATFRRVAIALVAAATLAGCGNFVRDKEIAANAMDDFHDRYNAGEYGKIYDTADAEFQSRNVRAEFLALLDGAHRKLGNYKTCDSQGWKTNSFNGNITVELHYRTTFAEGTADEDFLYAVAGKRATLRRYSIRSDVLITR